MKAQAGEEWRKVKGPEGGVWYVMGPGEDEWIADVPTKSLADRIISDHAQAATARKLADEAEPLVECVWAIPCERLRSELGRDTPDCAACSWHKAYDALAAMRGKA